MRSRFRLKAAVFFAAAMALCPACAKKDGFEVARTTERGVPVVKNSRSPRHPKAVLKVVRELSLGEKVDSFAVDAEGRMFVCREDVPRVKTFDSRGQALGSFETSGPDKGEVENPRLVGFTARGELAVESAGHGKLVFYARDGRLLRSNSLSGINTFRLGVNSRGEILIHIYRYVKSNMLFYLRVFDPELQELRTLGQYWEPQSVGNDFYAYLPILWWEVDDEDRVVYGYPQRYELQVFGPDGAPRRIIRKEQTPRPISEEEKAAYRKEVATAPYLRVHFPTAHSAFQKFSVDEKGWIYVLTWERTRDGRGYWYDVFDGEGVYAARVALDRVPQIWAGQRLYTLDADASGSAVLTRNAYEWIWR